MYRRLGIRLPNLGIRVVTGRFMHCFEPPSRSFFYSVGDVDVLPVAIHFLYGQHINVVS